MHLDGTPAGFSLSLLVRTLAEHGLWGRPMHMVVGNPLFSACVSPFTRDLKKPLQAYGMAHATTLAPGVAEELPAPTEDSVYAVSHAFLQQDPALLEEKERADKTVGIVQHVFEWGTCTSIDMQRISAHHCDTRMASSQNIGSQKIFLSVSLQPHAAHTASFVRAAIHAWGPSLHGLHLLSPVNMLPHTPEKLVLIPMVAPCSDNALCVLPSPSSSFTHTLQPCLYAPVVSEKQAPSETVSRCLEMYHAAAYDPSGELLLTARTLASLAWARKLAPHTHVSFTGADVSQEDCYSVSKAYSQHAAALFNTP